jgi:hypothetical protein
VAFREESNEDTPVIAQKQAQEKRKRVGAGQLAEHPEKFPLGLYSTFLIHLAGR